MGILEDAQSSLLNYKKRYLINPEFDFSVLAWDRINLEISKTLLFPCEPMTDIKAPNFVGYLFGVPVFIDEDLPPNSFEVRAHACKYCGTGKDDKRTTCPKCGAAY